MDIEFDLYDIRFVANEEKAFRNPQKHDGVTFELAAQAFFDPFLRVIDASRNTETRQAIIGMDEASRLLCSACRSGTRPHPHNFGTQSNARGSETL